MSHRLYRDAVKFAGRNPDVWHTFNNILVERQSIVLEVKSTTMNSERVTLINIVYNGSTLYHGRDIGWVEIYQICSEKIRLKLVEKVMSE